MNLMGGAVEKIYKGVGGEQTFIFIVEKDKRIKKSASLKQSLG